MGLNPAGRTHEQIEDDMLCDMFKPGESPYFAMYRAGKFGIPIEKVVSRLTQIGTAVRSKDIENWQAGMFEYQMYKGGCQPGKHGVRREAAIPFESMKLSDLPMFPQGWVGTEKRYFPCTMDNRPMQKWGWTKDYSPQLYDLASAKALSPCGWVGQNMLYQRFIVMDIDGRGHGEDDPYVIAFGNLYLDKTMCMEDPAKPGSFHLYFSTDRLVPIKHFPWAKLDLMGNSQNAAVYMKNKVGNGLPMMQLDEEVWKAMLSYQQYRKETR